MLSGSMGFEKLGQPQPLSNFVVEAQPLTVDNDVDVETCLLVVPEGVAERRLGGTRRYPVLLFGKPGHLGILPDASVYRPPWSCRWSHPPAYESAGRACVRVLAFLVALVSPASRPETRRARSTVDLPRRGDQGSAGWPFPTRAATAVAGQLPPTRPGTRSGNHSRRAEASLRSLDRAKPSRPPEPGPLLPYPGGVDRSTTRPSHAPRRSPPLIVAPLRRRSVPRRTAPLRAG